MSVSIQGLAKQIWRMIAPPQDHLEHESLRDMARLAVALLAALLLATLVFTPLWVLANPEYPEAPFIALAMILMLAVAYGLSRVGYISAGKTIGVSALPFFVLMVIFTATGPMTDRILALNLLVIALILSNIFFGYRVTLLLTGLSLIGISTFFFMPDVPPLIPFTHIVTLAGTAMFLIIIGTMIENSTQRLFASEDRFRSLFEQSNDAVFIVDFTGEPMRVNQRAAEIFGYTTDELAAMDYEALVAPSEQEHSQEVTRQIMAGGQLPPFERTYVRKDGTEFPAEVSVETVNDERGRLVRVQLIVRDISERKRGEQALREREKYLRTVIANAPGGMHFYQLAPDGRLLLENANPAATRILGIDHQPLFGLPIEEAFPGLIGTDVPAHYLEVAEHGGSWHAKEVTYQSGDIAGIFEVMAFQTVPGCMAVFFADITERKHAEQHALALAVEKERINVLKQFIENAAHELRTPLAIVNTKTFLLEKAPTEEVRLRHTESIREQTARLVKLLEMMNHMVMLDSHIPFVMQSADINELVHQAIARTGPTMAEKALDVNVESDTPLMIDCVDVRWLEEAIQNLVDNAVRFTPEQGSISARTYAQNENSVIEIRDTGIGISPDALPHIFERFWRADDAHSTPGFGLGLSIAQKVVEQHKGKIEVESSEGAGSTFRVILPNGEERCEQLAPLSTKPD